MTVEQKTRLLTQRIRHYYLNSQNEKSGNILHRSVAGQKFEPPGRIVTTQGCTDHRSEAGQKIEPPGRTVTAPGY
jgi:hypothetical protein